MGLSARRLANLSKSHSMLEDAGRYRNLAMKGVSEALSSFSKDNADAILCASIMIGDQQSDW
jgi:hypothetical protein